MNRLGYLTNTNKLLIPLPDYWIYFSIVDYDGSCRSGFFNWHGSLDGRSGLSHILDILSEKGQ